jgi:hypothetical protein
MLVSGTILDGGESPLAFPEWTCFGSLNYMVNGMPIDEAEDVGDVLVVAVDYRLAMSCQPNQSTAGP